MKNIATLLEKKYRTKLVVENWQDPSDGTLSLSAMIVCTYTNERLVKTNWHYDLIKCLAELDQKCSTLANQQRARKSGYAYGMSQYGT